MLVKGERIVVHGVYNTLSTVFTAFMPSVKKHWVFFAMSVVSMTGAILFGASFLFYTRNIVNKITSDSADISDIWRFFTTLVLLCIGTNICYRIFDANTELLEKKGEYADLWAHQIGGYLE